MSAGDDRLRRMVSDLHDEAMATISQGRLSWYKDVNQTYREITIAFPREAKRFGSPKWAESPGFFSLGPIDQIERAMYEEMTSAINSDNREIAFEAVKTPRRIAVDALSIEADDLALRMLKFLIHGYRLGRSRASDLGKIVASHVALLIVECVDLYIVFPLTRDTPADAAAQQRLADLTLRAFGVLADLARCQIDAGDREELRELEDRWNSMTEISPNQYSGPDDLDIAFVSEHEDDGSVSADVLRSLASIRGDLLSRYRLHVVQLLHWALRNPTRNDRDTQQHVIDLLGRRFSGLRDLTVAFNDALEAQWQGGTVLDSWIWEVERPGYGGGVSAPDEGLLTSFVIFGLGKLNPSQESALPPYRWIRLHKEELASRTAALTGEEDELLAVLVDMGDLEQRKSRFLELLDEAGRTQELEEKEVLRRAPLAGNLVTGFAEHVAEAWRRSRVLPSILAATAGTVSAAEPSTEDIAHYEWLPKAFFVEPVTLGGMHSFASRLGTRLANHELGMILDQISEKNALPEASSLAEQAHLAVQRFPSPRNELVVLIPRMWKLRSALGLQEFGTEAPQEWGLQTEQMHTFAGYIDGVPVFLVGKVPDYQMVIVRMGALDVTYLLDSVVNGPYIDVEAFDEDAAVALARESDPDQQRNPSELATQIQERVRAKVARWIRIEGRVEGSRFLYWLQK